MQEEVKQINRQKGSWLNYTRFLGKNQIHIMLPVSRNTKGSISKLLTSILVSPI